MKRKLLIGFLLCMSLWMRAQDYDYHFLLAGASFAVPENGWFELVCEAFNAEPINKAVSGEAIKHTAMAMYDNEFYTFEELERVDAFIIMHVHNQDVANTNGIKENYQDYTYEELQQYHLAYDYVIKRYMADCYELRNNPASQYYQTENGKPVKIYLTTHWHDSRISYNQSIRTLADRWQLPLVKWDENIGFTRKELDADGQQPSLKYALDTETIYGIVFGWHPRRGKQEYIQQRMAKICMDELKNDFTPVPASVTVQAKSHLVLPGESGSFMCTFTGIAPWNLTYTMNGQSVQLDSIYENPLIVSVPVNASITTVVPMAVSNATTANGTVSGSASISVTQTQCAPFYDTYVHQSNKTVDYSNDDHLEVKGNTPTHTREAFLSFNVAQVDPQVEKVVLRTYYYDCVYPGWALKETHRLEIAGNTEQYTSMNWNNKPTDFEIIGERDILAGELDSYIDWDVTDWVKNKIQEGNEVVTFRLKLGESDGTGLLYFYSVESSEAEKPQLLILNHTTPSACVNTDSSAVKVRTDAANNEISLSGIDRPFHVACFSLSGVCVYDGDIVADTKIKLPDTLSGLYVLQLQNASYSYVYKVVI